MKRLERWSSVYPWTQWHTGHQRAASDLVARELAALAQPLDAVDSSEGPHRHAVGA